MDAPPVWLEDPQTIDDSYARRGEYTLHWLARSTVPRARECRRFLNESLAALPREAQPGLRHALQARWHSAFFELVVLRLLQELGAAVEYEPDGAGGTRPDVRATFPDGAVVVEAVAPVFNAEVGEVARNYVPLLDLIEQRKPSGWHVGVPEIPAIGPNDSKKEFVRVVEEMLDPATLDAEAGHIELVRELGAGTIRLWLWPASRDSERVAIDPIMTAWDTSEKMIRKAVKSKKRQARGAGVPVLLAAYNSALGASWEDFDIALFGRTYERLDFQGRVVETGFEPSGAFNPHRTDPPTYAGVLAFIELGLAGGPQPIIYRQPRYTGTLPAALMDVEQRIYDAERGTVEVVPARRDDLMQALRFARRNV